MYCPFCATEDTKVIDSRLSTEGDQVRRRRECTQCSERFTTYEKVELVLPSVVKSDDKREAFDETKLRAGLSRALERRPVASEHVEDMVNHIRKRLMALGEREVSSRTVGEWVMDELREVDHVAYVRFASVYRNFEDVNEFRDEIDRLQQGPSPELSERQAPLIADDD
ncbi:MAG TPA: transcriptional regulator NrdR [Chromatiales bacterium]|jgi:transcriptional repressor NrdR|nr:transcriptional regulator NrdR [Chromatiaceae bacterium]HIB85415.1 transcriptional regulator NrdR [Chromatiaceae bacterium]HIN82635.1 transcriptional regulator NrdR [Chromatiales bacterium]HIO15082.1 transcriptional regulator NrdR [Chromatiales bacterium]HIO54158.1 transcriptional regulator NrdR [Chromatiales bacterium]